MAPGERTDLSRRFAVFVSTVQHMPNPVDDLDGWQRRWADLHQLVAEIDSLNADATGS